MTESKFKPGPARTNYGQEVVIYEVSDRIYGKVICQDGFALRTWDLNGKAEVTYVSDTFYYDLFDPDRPLFKEETIIKGDVRSMAKVESAIYSVYLKRQGRFKVTIEELTNE